MSVEYHITPRTIFGASDKTLKVEIKGTVDNDIVMGKAYRADRPDQEVACKLTRRMDLPAT